MPILLVKRATNDGDESPYLWKAGQIVAAVHDNHEFSVREAPDFGNFFHVAVTDKTLEEVQAYLSDWKHSPTITQVSRQGNNRLIEVVSDMVSATGKNAFVRSAVEQLLVDISGTYDSHTQNSFRFRISASNGEAPGIIAQIEEAVKGMQYARRRWYFTQVAMALILAQGGSVSGTAQQVAGYMRDGLLD